MVKKVILFIFLLSPVFGYCQDKIDLILYHSPHCKACLRVKNEVLPQIKEQYKDKLQWVELDTTVDPGNLSQLLALNREFGRQNSLVPAILVGARLLVGESEIRQDLIPAIEEALGEEPLTRVLTKEDLEKVFNKFSVFTVGFAGLVDGINPCAFAVIVFFISFLAFYGYKRREIIYIGSSYCLAVFISYLLIGLGFFHFLYSISNIYIFIKTFYWIVAGFCFILAAFSLKDYFQYKKSGSSGNLSLQLPKFLKKQINRVIGSQLREKKPRTPLELVGSAFLIGLMVSVFEAVCTGQVYLPIIVAILKYPGLKAKALLFLVIYNLAFIIPLIVIFLLSLLGFSSQWFNQFLKKHLGAIKILMAILFVSLGLLILGYEYIYPHISGLFKNIIIQWVR